VTAEILTYKLSCKLFCLLKSVFDHIIDYCCCIIIHFIIYLMWAIHGFVRSLINRSSDPGFHSFSAVIGSASVQA
jgi:hypothetical protein